MSKPYACVGCRILFDGDPETVCCPNCPQPDVQNVEKVYADFTREEAFRVAEGEMKIRICTKRCLQSLRHDALPKGCLRSIPLLCHLLPPDDPIKMAGLVEELAMAPRRCFMNIVKCFAVYKKWDTQTKMDGARMRGIQSNSVVMPNHGSATMIPFVKSLPADVKEINDLMRVILISRGTQLPKDWQCSRASFERLYARFQELGNKFFVVGGNEKIPWDTESVHSWPEKPAIPQNIVDTAIIANEDPNPPMTNFDNETAAPHKTGGQSDTPWNTVVTEIVNPSGLYDNGGRMVTSDTIVREGLYQHVGKSPPPMHMNPPPPFSESSTIGSTTSDPDSNCNTSATSTACDAGTAGASSANAPPIDSKSYDADYVLYPKAQDKAVSEFEWDFLPSVYPMLYPDSNGGWDRYGSVSFSEYRAHLINLVDSPFEKHYSWLFHTANVARRMEIYSLCRKRCQ